jgi:hypothetical protein
VEPKVPTVAGVTKRYSRAELDRMCKLYFPEERRREFTSEPWDGVSFRHYRDPKIACLEHYRPLVPPAEVKRAG